MIFNIPSIARANLLLTYLSIASASDSVETEPIPMKDCVYPIRGSPIRGVDKTSPIAPVPFALGTIPL